MHVPASCWVYNYLSSRYITVIKTQGGSGKEAWLHVQVGGSFRVCDTVCVCVYDTVDVVALALTARMYGDK